MSELVPVTPTALSVFTPLTDPAGGSVLTRLRSFAAQEPVRRALPWFGGVAALGGLALTWAMLAPQPQRTLYSQLNDSERASVVAALDKASISYRIDNETGALTVDEGDLYRARMLVASDGALAAPETGREMIDSLPMGASRTLEGERLRSAREHELALTIMEIDGVEAVRVHLAEGEKSVFVRENVPPSASVMVRLARGRQLAEGQVAAIVNLVAAAVPGLSPDTVKVIDQHGRLLSEASPDEAGRIALQSRMEEKLRAQLSQLLTPVLGEGNFTSEVQVDLDMNEVTSARENYDKQGAVRTETQQASRSTNAPAIGVPGVMSNTPPPATTLQPGAPQGTTAIPGASGSGETSSSRTYELGREVAVSNTTPGNIRRLSVAVALSEAAMKKGSAADVEKIRQLVSAAVGADPARGDQVTVVSRPFEAADVTALPFYDKPWFGPMMNNGAALLAVLLVLLLGVRPLIAAFRGAKEAAAEEVEGVPLSEDNGTITFDDALISQHIGFAQRLVAERPDSAVIALRHLLAEQRGEAEQ